MEQNDIDPIQGVHFDADATQSLDRVDNEAERTRSQSLLRNRNEVREIQQALKQLQLYEGEVNGEWGKLTAEALRLFARLQQLRLGPNGSYTTEVFNALRDAAATSESFQKKLEATGTLDQLVQQANQALKSEQAGSAQGKPGSLPIAPMPPPAIDEVNPFTELGRQAYSAEALNSNGNPFVGAAPPAAATIAEVYNTQPSTEIKPYNPSWQPYPSMVLLAPMELPARVQLYLLYLAVIQAPGAIPPAPLALQSGVKSTDEKSSRYQPAILAVDLVDSVHPLSFFLPFLGLGGVKTVQSQMSLAVLKSLYRRAVRLSNDPVSYQSFEEITPEDQTEAQHLALLSQRPVFEALAKLDGKNADLSILDMELANLQQRLVVRQERQILIISIRD